MLIVDRNFRIYIVPQKGVSIGPAASIYFIVSIDLFKTDPICYLI